MSDNITAYINIPNHGFVPINIPIPTDIINYAVNPSNYEQFTYQQQTQNQYLFQEIQKHNQYLQYQMEILNKIQEEQETINKKINELSKKKISEKIVIEQDNKIEKILNEFKLKQNQQIKNDYKIFQKEMNETIKKNCDIIKDGIENIKQNIDSKIQITKKETNYIKEFDFKIKDLEEKIIILESSIKRLQNEDKKEVKKIKKEKTSDDIVKELKQYINNNIEINTIKEDNKELKNKLHTLRSYIEKIKSNILHDDNTTEYNEKINIFYNNLESLVQNNMKYIGTELFTMSKLLLRHSDEIDNIKEILKISDK
jgi:hypothetical protein